MGSKGMGWTIPIVRWLAYSFVSCISLPSSLVGLMPEQNSHVLLFSPSPCLLTKRNITPHKSVDAPTGKLMMLPTDLVLLEDKKFAKWVAYYGKDGNKFNADFSKAFQKLEELGTKNLAPTDWA